MPDEAVAVAEQAPPETPEATPVTEVEVEPSTEPVADGAGEPVGDGALERAAEPPEPSSIEELAERHQWLKDRLAERDRDRENAGAQRREAQLRREAGSRERIRADVSTFLQAQGLDPEEVVRDAPQYRRAEFMYALAEARAASEIAVALPDIIKTGFEVPPDVREEAARVFDQPLNEQGDRNYQAYLKVLIDGAVGAEVAKREAVIRKEIEDANRKWRADEEKAMRAAATPQPSAAPAAPRAAASNGALNINNASDADAAYNAGRITHEQYRQLRQQYGVGVAPGGGR